MALIFTHAYTKKSEYSEFERENSVIEVVVFFDRTQVVVGDSFRLEITKARRNRDEIVTDSTYTFSSLPTSDNVTISFDMTMIKSQDAVNVRLMRRGFYFVKAVDVLNPTNTISTPDFRVSIVTAFTIKNKWLFGMTLAASDVVRPKNQPVKITGVKITDVSMRHPVAQYPLTFTVQGNRKWISWAGGESVELDLSHPIYPQKEYFLPGEIGIAVGIRVLIDPPALLDHDEVERIYIDSATLDNNLISDLINDAVDITENIDLMIFLEPTICVTEIDPRTIGDDVTLPENSDWDKITTPVTYYGVTPGHWAEVQFPFQYILRLDYLMGTIAGNRVISVLSRWAEKNYQSSFTQLVPLQMEMAFNYLALMWAPTLWGIRDLPNFWHYKALAGLREIPSDLLEYIGRRAAISAMTIAGQAYKGGFAGQSVSRDGISESVSYTSSAMYGIYSAYIQDHTNWIQERLPLLRNKYRGLMFRVV